MDIFVNDCIFVVKTNVPRSVCCVTIALMVILLLLEVRDFIHCAFYCPHSRADRLEYIFLKLFLLNSSVELILLISLKLYVLPVLNKFNFHCREEKYYNRIETGVEGTFGIIGLMY